MELEQRRANLEKMREEEKAERKRRNEEMAKKAAGRTLELAEGSMAGYEAK